MPAGKRSKSSRRRPASPDKPRERARRAEAMVELLTRGVHRLKLEVAQWRTVAARELDRDRFAALELDLTAARDTLYPLTDEERAIAEIPW